MIELAPGAYQSKSNVSTDSGVFDRTGASYPLPTSSVSFRNNVSTSANDDGPRTRENNVYIATTAIGSSSPYAHRQVSDLDRSPVRSTYKYDAERFSSESLNQHPPPRTARRQLTHAPQADYESPSMYRSGPDLRTKVPITTQSRSVKPFVVDEIETIETETKVECQVQRTHETSESIRTDPGAGHLTSPQRSRSTYDLNDEKTPAKRVLIQEPPRYYEPARSNDDESPRGMRANVQTYATSSHPTQMTTLSTQTQVTFEQSPSKEIVATVHIPEFNAVKTTQPPTIRQGSRDLERLGRIKSEDELYQRSQSNVYRASPANQGYQHQVRARVGKLHERCSRHTLARPFLFQEELQVDFLLSHCDSFSGAQQTIFLLSF